MTRNYGRPVATDPIHIEPVKAGPRGWYVLLLEDHGKLR